jgi:hypothetical protein
VAPDGSTPRASEPTVLRRLPRRFGTTTFTPPTNVMVNNPAGDGPVAGQSETSIAGFGDVMVAAWNDFPANGVNDQQGWGYSSDGGVTWATVVSRRTRRGCRTSSGSAIRSWP